MIEIRRGNASEFYEIIDFIDYVFSMHNWPHHYPKLSPVLYRETDKSMHNMINLREDGIMKASLLCYPRTLSVGGRELKVCGVGSVATHPRARNRGFMTMIMDYCMEEMKKDGVHLSYLGGDRARYGRFGYEISGNSYNFSLSLKDIKGRYPDFDASEYTFRRLERDEVDLHEALLEIYSQKKWHYVYDAEEFYLRMTRIGAIPMVIYEGDEIIGFMDTHQKSDPHTINEVCVKDDDTLRDVLFSYMMQNGVGISCRIGEWQLGDFKDLIEIINREVSFSGSAQWKVLNWQEVLKTLFEFKAGYTALLPGELVLDIDGEVLQLSYDGKSTAVMPCDKPAKVHLPGLSATRALLGPVPEAVFGNMEDAKLRALLKSWFPLPLTLFSPESV